MIAAARAWRLVLGIALLAGATGFLAVTAVLLMDTGWASMRTEGSPAGTIALVVFGAVGLFAGIAGFLCVVSGATLLAYGTQSRALIVLGSLVVVALAAWGVARNFIVSAAADARDPVKSRRQAERSAAYWAARWEGVERLEGGVYRLVWKGHRGRPPMELMLPEEDLRPDLAAPPLPDKEGSSPVRFPLVGTDARGATLTLYLSAEHERVQRAGPSYRPDPEIAPLWVSRKDGEWRYLGIDCRRAAMLGIEAGPAAPACYTPRSPVDRWLPWLHGIERVVLRGDDYAAGCRMIFPFQGRPAVLQTAGSCLGDESFAAFKAATELLDRLQRDTAAAPADMERVARVRSATANCEKAGKGVPRTGGDSLARRMRAAACGYAIQLAEREMPGQPGAIVPLLLRSLEAGPPEVRDLDGGHVGAALRGLDAAGQKDARSLVHAHVLRIEAVDGAKAAARPSVETLLSHAAALPGPGEPLFERTYDAVRKASLPPTQAAQRLALLASLHERARAMDASSELALKTRYGLCRERASMGVERETLKACADDLASEWRVRAARAGDFAAFDGENELAIAIARMYAESSEAASGDSAAAQGLRRTRELATARISPRWTEVFDDLDKREAQLAPRRPSRGPR